MLWGAIPRTGGSAWQNYNKQFPGAAAKTRQHIKLLNKLFANFMILARLALSFNGIIVNEWPKGCAYWKYPNVKEFFAEINAYFMEINGCALGLKSIVEDEKYITKPWSLACANFAFLDGLGCCLCPGVSPSHQHAPCAGRDTKRTEDYTDMMVNEVRKSFLKLMQPKPVHAACAIAIKPSSSFPETSSALATSFAQ